MWLVIRITKEKSALGSQPQISSWCRKAVGGVTVVICQASFLLRRGQDQGQSQSCEPQLPAHKAWKFLPPQVERESNGDEELPERLILASYT